MKGLGSGIPVSRRDNFSGDPRGKKRGFCINEFRSHQSWTPTGFGVRGPVLWLAVWLLLRTAVVVENNQLACLSIAGLPNKWHPHAAHVDASSVEGEELVQSLHLITVRVRIANVGTASRP